MAKIYSSAKTPIGMGVDAAAYEEGQLLKKSSTAGRLCKSAAKGDEIVGIVDQDTLTAKGDAKTVAAGHKVGVWRLGNGELVWIQSISGQTYNPGGKIYASATAAQATATPDTSRPIGTYPEWMVAQTTTAAGEKVPCILDVPVGANNVAGA